MTLDLGAFHQVLAQRIPWVRVSCFIPKAIRFLSSSKFKITTLIFWSTSTISSG